MKIVLIADQESLHRRALKLAREHRAVEAALVRTLIEIDRLKLYLPLGYPSLFQYAVGALQMSESVAYAFILVARKARSVPELAAALEGERLSVAKASRIASALDAGNAQALIEFAATHAARETEREAARFKPRGRKRDSVREVDGEMVEIRILIPKDAFADLERVQALEAQCGRDASLAAAVAASAHDYLRRRDPVAKAHRSQERRTFKVAPRRAPIKAESKHDVVARDGGRCAFVGADGKRCGGDRWLHFHHVVPVANGGTDDPTNLVLLCSEHHALVHQTSFPIDYQVSWLRERTVEYSNARVDPCRSAAFHSISVLSPGRRDAPSFAPLVQPDDPKNFIYLRIGRLGVRAQTTPTSVTADPSTAPTAVS